MAMRESVCVNECSPATNDLFDPVKHMNYSKPTELTTLEELGLETSKAISPVAITNPFPLFSNEGVEAIRADVFRREVVGKHIFKEPKRPGYYKLRGYADDAPFIKSVWTNETLLQACSEAAGCELEVVFDYEMAHINVQLPPELLESDNIDLLIPPAKPPRALPSSTGVTDDDMTEGESMAWHRDSYPWVCVVMLSDPTGMSGGETGLKTGDGRVLKVRGPSTGFAVMMQGGLVNHCALNLLGDGERVTMVTSFRPKNPLVYDGSHLGNVKRSSDNTRLFKQWTAYRAQNVAKRAQYFSEQVQSNAWHVREIQDAATAWAEKEIQFIQFTLQEMTDRGTAGYYK